MRAEQSQVEYCVLALVQGFIVMLLATAWVIWWAVRWCAFWVFEILIACLQWLCQNQTCSSTVKLLRLLPPDFGLSEEIEDTHDVD